MINEKWKKKWAAREKEVKEFYGKALKTQEEVKKLREKLQTALQDQQTLSQLARKESEEKKELYEKNSELLEELEEARRSFIKKLFNKKNKDDTES